MRTYRVPSALLLALSGSLALGLARELLSPWKPTASTGTVAPLPAMPAPPNDYTPATLSNLSDRPLFTRTRRPTPTATAEAPSVAKPTAARPPPAVPEPATKLTLIGIIDGPAAKIALIRVANEPVPVRATEGADVDQWKVQQILADHVILARSDTVQELHFPASKPNSPHH